MAINGPITEELLFLSGESGLTLLGAGHLDYDTHVAHFLENVAGAEVIAIHKNHGARFPWNAHLESFPIFENAVRHRNNNNANVRLCWLAMTRESLCITLRYGFVGAIDPRFTHNYGLGTHLNAYDHLQDCVQYCNPDDRGIRYIMLCRAILGRMEQIPFRSQLVHASSPAFDSGVDNLQNPTMHIVWTSQQNTNLFPEFIISFRQGAR